MNYKLGDVFLSKKPHPCGNDKWEIIRIGADYKIKCLKCGRIVLLSYEELCKSIKKIIDE